MRLSVAAAFCLSVAAVEGAEGASRKIDLRTKEGVQTVKADWRYADVKIVEAVGKAPDGRPNKTYNYEPNATNVVKTDFDDSKWELVDPLTLKNPRGGGQICFGWYRTKITIPADIPAGKKVFFQTIVDDYGEVWVDGKLPRKPGDSGGPVVAGFNAANGRGNNLHQNQIRQRHPQDP